jgi:Flp pilus assembly protein TadD
MKWSGFRASVFALSVAGLGGCAVFPANGSWFSAAMLEELRTQQEYADFISARYAGMVGDSEAAATYYRRAYSSSPGDSGLLERAAIATLASGDTEAAIQLARSARPAVSEDSPSAQLALIIDDIEGGRIKSAKVRLQKPALGALNLDLAAFVSAWLTAAEDPVTGVAEVDALPGRRMIAGEQAALKAIVLMHGGQDEAALQAFQHALHLPLASRDVVAVLGGSMLASRGDMQGARELVALAAVDGDPDAGSERLLADIDAGRKIARPKLSTREGAALAIYIISGTGLVRSSPDLSAMRHAMALHLDPKLAAASLVLADAYERQDRADDALAVLRGIPATSPWAANARMSEAAILDRDKRAVEALAAADEALGLSKQRDLVLQAGDLNRMNGRTDVARKLYDAVIADDKARNMADWRVLFARSTMRSEEGDWAGAEADLQAALSIEPDRPELLNYLGYGWVNRGERVQEGLALIQRAADARPDQGYIIDSLGWAYFKLGQMDRAIEYLERAAELTPTDAEVIDHLGDAYWRAGRQTEARFEWSAALDLKPDAVREAALRQKLDGGLPAAPGASLASRP